MAQVTVEVVYAAPGGEDVVRIEIPAGATLREAVEASGICARHPEIDFTRNKVGVFGAIRAVDSRVAAGDRIEIYRPLISDPKQSRRARARAASRRTSR